MKSLEMFSLSNRKYLFLFLLPLFFSCGVFAFDVTTGAWTYTLKWDIGGWISDYLTNFVAKREQNSYLNAVYTSKFSSDPFADALEHTIQNSLSPLLWGMENVNSWLQKKSCSLSRKEISSILYYFDEDFRSKMLIQLSQNTNQYFQPPLDREATTRACRKFADCYFPGLKEPMSVCQSNILSWYQQGLQNTTRFDSVLNTQIGKDKYRNSSLDDSPYDIMYDINAIGKVFFEDIQSPVQVLFYHMPNFKGSSNWSSSSSGQWENSDSGSSNSSLNWSWSTTTPNTSTGGTTSLPDEASQGGSSLWELEDDDEFSDFLNANHDQGTTSSLGGKSMQSTMFGWNICIGTIDELPDVSEKNTESDWDIISLDDVTDEEYQEYIDDLLDQLDSYLDLPKDIPFSGSNVTTGSNSILNNSDLDNYENAVKQVETCFSSCNGLRIDQKAACMAMCACGQRDSPLFDPYKTPGLGPIMSIKFCTVPVTSKSFSQRGVVVYSIEEIFNQLYGVLDSLDRSGELWINVKQSEFLDSSTKKMSFPKSISFTISQSAKIPSNADGKGTEYFQKAQLKKENDILMQEKWISHPIEDPVRVNDYVMVQNIVEDKMKSNYSSSINNDQEKSSQESLQKTSTLVSDVSKNYQNQRYIQLSAEMYRFLDYHLSSWIEISNTIAAIDATARVLSAKNAS